MLLNGLGGQVLSANTPANSARLINATQPEFLATLVVSFPQGEQRFRQGFPEWEPLDQPGLFARNGAVSASPGAEAHRVPQRPRLNWLGTQGVLGAETSLLAEVAQAMRQPSAHLRAAWQRGL